MPVYVSNTSHAQTFLKLVLCCAALSLRYFTMLKLLVNVCYKITNSMFNAQNNKTSDDTSTLHPYLFRMSKTEVFSYVVIFLDLVNGLRDLHVLLKYLLISLKFVKIINFPWCGCFCIINNKSLQYIIF